MLCILNCLGQLFLEGYSQKLIILRVEKQKIRIQINKNNCTCFQAFNVVLHKAIKQAENAGNIQCHISNLKIAVTYSTYIFRSQGLFEKDKLIFLAQTAFQVRKNFPIGDTDIYWVFCVYLVEGDASEQTIYLASFWLCSFSHSVTAASVSITEIPKIF